MIKNGKVAGPSGLVAEMAKSWGETVVDMILEINQILAEGVILVDQELCITVNVYKGKDDALERENQMKLELTDKIFK